jgi:hypothetical protein
VLLDVRLPVAALLSGLALAAGITSLVWVRLARAAVAGVPWVALAAVAVVGTYVVPGFAAAARSPDQRARADLIAAQRDMLGHAFGATAVEAVVAPVPSPDPELITRHSREIAMIPVWDPPMLQAIFAGTGADSSHERWTAPALGVYWSAEAGHVPAFVAVHERDLLAAREADPDLTWRDAHAEPRAFGTGAVAVLAGAASETGLPHYIPDLARPESSATLLRSLALKSDRIAFSPAAETFAVLDSGTTPVAGIRVRGAWRRLALAWALQSPQMLSAGAVSPGSTLLWPRGVVQRLERLAPFARFGAPYPAILDGRVVWLAPGYVTSVAFPLSVATEFGSRRVRAVRSGFLGTVDAHDGATAVYLLPAADPLSAAWAELAPDIVQPLTRLPPDVLSHARYPEELFEVQLPLLLAGGAQGLPVLVRRGTVGPTASTSARPMWLPAAAIGGPPSAVVLRAVAVSESGAVEAVIDGVVESGTPRLHVVRVRAPAVMNQDPTPEGWVRGRPRALAFPEGLVTVIPLFAGTTNGNDLPRLAQVMIAVGGVGGRGSTLEEAIARLQAALGAPPAASAQWREARRWFARMDQARRAGDWAEFGRAWQELARVLGAPRDTTP